MEREKKDYVDLPPDICTIGVWYYYNCINKNK